MASQELEVLQESSNDKNSKRGKTRKWTEEETEKLIDLLEKNTCFRDVSKKEYHLKNKREKSLSDMSDELAIEVLLLRRIHALEIPRRFFDFLSSSMSSLTRSAAKHFRVLRR